MQCHNKSQGINANGKSKPQKNLWTKPSVQILPKNTRNPRAHPTRLPQNKTKKWKSWIQQTIRRRYRNPEGNSGIHHHNRRNHTKPKPKQHELLRPEWATRMTWAHAILLLLAHAGLGIRQPPCSITRDKVVNRQQKLSNSSPHTQ